MHPHATSLTLTFAGPRALDPAMMNACVASTSAILIPSTTGGAATGSARFRKLPALWAHRRAIDC